MKLISKPIKSSGTNRGYIYNVQVIEYTPKGLTGRPNSRVAYQDYITREDVRSNPEIIYLFGDNLEKKGRGGQAKEMRGLPNTIGIPTKKSPTMDDAAFFTDDEFTANKAAIDEAFASIPKGVQVVIPSAGLGTGYAQLKERAPKTAKYLENKIQKLAKETLISPDLSDEKAKLDELEDNCELK